MPVTYNLIASATAAGGETTITFSSIPQTYTDLVLRIVHRSNNAVIWNAYPTLRPNSATGTYVTYLTGTGTAVQAFRYANDWYAIIDSTFNYGADSNGNTSSTFSNIEYYIPSYTVAQTRQVHGYGVAEQNSGTAYMSMTANYYNSTTAITSLVLRELNGIFGGSTYYLYGIKNS